MLLRGQDIPFKGERGEKIAGIGKTQGRTIFSNLLSRIASSNEPSFALFKPKTVEVSTSHVDILPTLLDAMKIPYDPGIFGRESLFKKRLKRKYLFFYGLEECISSLDTNLIKVQYSLKKRSGWAFDLKIDPDERKPLDISLYRSQVEDLHRFVGVHDSRLVGLPASSSSTPESPSRGATSSKASPTAASPKTTSSR